LGSSFITLGDNDWNDCPNPSQGLSYWKREFLYFHQKYWNVGFDVKNMPGRPENLSFVWKNTLFFVVDMPGSVRGLIGQVVIFAHADPDQYHAPFFDPLTNFIANELRNSIPIMYMNGDGHYWQYRPNFYGQASFLRIMLTAETVNPPLKVMIPGTFTQLVAPEQVFQYDREVNLYGSNSYLGIAN